MSIILSTIHSVDQVCHYSWVSAILMQNVNIARLSPYLNTVHVQ